MLCFNLPRKTAAMIQVWGCIALVLVAIFLTFAPIITIDLVDEDTAAMVEDFLYELDLTEEPIDIPEKLEVTSLKLLGSISLISKTISVAGDENPSEKDVKELEEMMKGEEGQNTMLTVAAIVATITDVFGGEENEEAGLVGMILNVLVVVVCLIYCLIFTLIAPVVYIIVGLTALIPALTNIKDPAAVSAKVAKKLPGMLSFPMIFILFQCVIPTLHYGWGAMGLWIVAFVCTLLNVVVSRMRMYDAGEMKYLNIMQPVSLVAVAGYLVFFFNIIKTGVFHTFITGHWGEAVIMATAAGVAEEEVVSNGYIVDAVLVLLAVLFVASSIDYLKNVLQRISCASKKGGDCHIAYAILMVAAAVLPMVVLNSQNYYTDMTNLDAEPAGSFLDGLTTEGEAALTMALIGAIIAVAAEIVLIVLKKVLCEDVSKETIAAVVTGEAKTPEEKLAEAEATLAAAKAAAEANLAAAQATVAAAEAAKAAEAAAPVAEEAPAAEEAPVAEEAAEETKDTADVQ